MPREKNVPTITQEKAARQLEELYEAQNPVVEAPEAPSSAEPGSHPLRPISSDMEAASELFFADPQDLSGKRCVWDLTSYNAPVLHYF